MYSDNIYVFVFYSKPCVGSMSGAAARTGVFKKKEEKSIGNCD